MEGNDKGYVYCVCFIMFDVFVIFVVVVVLSFCRDVSCTTTTALLICR